MDVIPAPAPPRVPVRDRSGTPLGTFPVHRIYCVGRNFADHAREMGAIAPASKAERGTPTFFMKPADAIVTDGVVPYPPGTCDLHHEVELVVALGDCGCDGGIFGESYASCGAVANVIAVDVMVPGCPPPPLEILRGILTAVRRRA